MLSAYMKDKLNLLENAELDEIINYIQELKKLRYCQLEVINPIKYYDHPTKLRRLKLYRSREGIDFCITGEFKSKIIFAVNSTVYTGRLELEERQCLLIFDILLSGVGRVDSSQEATQIDLPLLNAIGGIIDKDFKK